MSKLHITSVRFTHYKAFTSFTLGLQDFNVLVGPNNSGKSTIVGAFRILHEGLRKARAKSPDRVEIDGEMTVGYWIDIDDLPVAAENIFHDYDDSRPARVQFLLSNGSSLALYFPERGSCVLVPQTEGRIVRSPREFKAAFDFDIAFVPILGPVELHEPLYAKEAARRALLTTGASRNFRNIWFHYPEGFEQFRELVQSTWPGMDIERPEISEDGRHLLMFCPEERLPREVCWAGYGFQVWCQMLTFIVKGAGASLLVIDEPDIYLHSDLQRQLVALLRELGPDVLIATHSTEIISECDPGALLNVNKRSRVATRIRDASQLSLIFSALGSSLNPTLTQLTKTRRVVLVESAVAFQVLSPLARTLGMRRIANRADFAVVHTDGLDARRAEDVIAGIERAVGSSVAAAVILDRKYRSEREVREISQRLAGHGVRVHVADRYAVENYVMVPSAIQRAVGRRLGDAAARSSSSATDVPEVVALLAGISESMRHQVLARMVATRIGDSAHRSGERDVASVNVAVLGEFERIWAEDGGKLRLIPGSQLLASLNEGLDGICGVAISDVQIAAEMRQEEIPNDAITLLKILQDLIDHDVPTVGYARGRGDGTNAGSDGGLRDVLRHRDSMLGSHRAEDGAAEWEDVSADLPSKGRISKRD